jgi:hypothetical protein
MNFQLLHGTDAQQIAEQTRVMEIELWRLDQALSQIHMPGRKPVGDVSGLQDGNPAARRRVSDAAVGAESG